MSSPEHAPTVDLNEAPRTPENLYNKINVADAYDLQHRVNNAEQETSVARIKLEREKRRTRRCQIQINEYMEALTRSTQDYSRMMNQCQLLSNTNLALSQDLQKAKLMVETLEAVIMMFYTSSINKDGSAGTSLSNGRGLPGDTGVDPQVT